MYLFKIFYSFLPLRNPIGFGASDFIVLALALLLVALLIVKAFVSPYLERIARQTWLSMALLFGLAVLSRLALLAQCPVPIPSGADDFSYVLLGDTLAHFRLANAEHPLHQFFEAVFVLQHPTYASIYPLGQGLVLGLGALLMRSYWAGVLISGGAMCALCYWMLRAWVKPSWAFAGGLLAIIEFGPLNPWMNSYWGGYVSAIAGCLVFGSLPRLAESPRLRNGLLLGLGLGLQILTRPFETIFLALAAVGYLGFTFRRTSRSILRPALGVVGVITAALGLTLLQNKAVTKSWMTMPYMLSRYEYGVPTTFTFQQNPVPHSALTREQELDYKAQAAIHGNGADGFLDYWSRLGYRFRFLRFFIFPPLYFALLAFLPNLRSLRYRWAVSTILLFFLGTNFYPYFFPHYVAALTCLFVLFSVRGLEMLNTRCRSYVFALCCASFAFWFCLYLSGDSDLLPINNFQSWNYINRGDPQGRESVQSQLSREPGKQLVFVRYSPAHKFEEWVHNDADIDSAQTVWANDLSDAENDNLMRYFPQRKPWLLQPDTYPPALTPYSRNADLFETVH